jgi:precorrin-6B methylase 2
MTGQNNVLISVLVVLGLLIIYALCVLIGKKIQWLIDTRRFKHWLYSPKMERYHHLCTTLYPDNKQAMQASQQAKRLFPNQVQFTYGEITFLSFSHILSMSGPKAQDVFCDLGSGAGKAVIAASLLYPFERCVGIELVPDLYQLSMQKKDALKTILQNNTTLTGAPIDFFNQDLLHTPLHTFDVLYVNATCFIGDMWEHLQTKLREVKTGARIIMVSRFLHDPSFQLQHRLKQTMSWGDCSILIFIKLPPPSKETPRTSDKSNKQST